MGILPRKELLGVQKGDRVTIYLPVIPEQAIAMMAVAKIGAIHSVVFGGFSSEALADRIQDAESKMVITADGGFYRGGIVPLKENTDRAVSKCPTVQHVLVFRRTGAQVPMQTGRDLWMEDANGATIFMAEGAPDYPDPSRWWSIIQRYGINILYTTPTAIRFFMRYGEKWVKDYDLSTLRLLGTVGEPINPEAWVWYHENIGQRRCPITDTIRPSRKRPCSVNPVTSREKCPRLLWSWSPESLPATGWWKN